MSFHTLSQNVGTRQAATQTQQARVDQVKNNAGGFVFELDPLKKLDRFLIIGTQGGTFYQAERDLLQGNMSDIIALIKTQGKMVVDRAVEISQAGRAKNNDYALLVMALVFTHGDDFAKQYAKSKLNLVARTGTHFFHFVQFANGLRGWGRSLKKAVQGWYSAKSTDNLAYQMVKYKSRDGWDHRDVMRLAHVKPGTDPVRQSLYKYAVKGFEGLEAGDRVPSILVAVKQAQTADKASLIKLITDNRLSHEMIPNEMKNNADVWAALLPHMGMTAMIRNLNKLTALGMLKPLSSTSKFVKEQLQNGELIKRERIHPLSALVAKKIYQAGKGDKGSLVWTPDTNIVSALEDTFYLAFDAVEPSGKNMMLALDVSGSMSSKMNGAPQIMCCEGTAVMAMVTARTEPNTYVFGFTNTFKPLGITKNDNLDSAMQKVYDRNFGTTNCAAPMEYALANKLDVDCFSIYTDNETYAGRTHPFQALRNYRNKMNKPEAKMIVCGMTSTGFSIADPKDAGMMDVVGFDTNTPKFISEFAAGRL
ncbi:hypothetical protein D3C87_278320 [compost metagenome]